MARSIYLSRVIVAGAIVASAAACQRAAPSTKASEITGAQAARPSPSTHETAPGKFRPVRIEMKNVRLHAAEGIVLGVTSLSGDMVSRNPAAPPVFDDSKAYFIRVDSGRITMDMASLTRLMNDYIFADESAPLHDITMEV